MKKIKKVLLFFVLVLSIVLASCNGNKVSVTVNYGFDFEPKTVSAEELDGKVLKAEKEGYTLVGWYYDDYFTTEYITNTKIQGNINIYAKWEAVKYNINYHLDGGTNNEANPLTYTIENEVTLAEPTKEGFAFLGWYKEEALTNKVTSIAKGTTKDIDLYAKWTEEVLVTFVVDNDVVKTVNVSKGEQIVIPTAPVKEGYTFENWYLGNNVYEIAEVSESITVVGKYNINSYDVKYFVDDNEFGSEKVDYNNKANGLDNNPSKTGYEFKGWFVNSTTKFNFEEDRITSNTNLYAKFEPVNYEIEYRLDGGTNNASNPSTYTIEDEVVLQKPSKDGYSFKGWVSETGAPVSKIETGTTGKITLIATYEENVIITFVVDNKVYKTINITNGDELEFPSVPVKDGYTFENWYVGEEVFSNLNVDASVTVTAKFNLNRYKVTYYVGDNEFGSEYVDYNNFVGGLEANPSKTGYEFKGWYKEEALQNEFNVKTETIKSATSLYAKFEAIEYSITYALEADEINSANNPATYTIETETITLADASKEGHKFIGWYSDAKYQNKVEKIEKGSTGNVVLYVLFEIETYKVNYIVDGKTISTEDVIYNNPVVGVNTPSKTGYEFAGWYLDSEYKNEFNLKTDVIKNTTNLYAKFNAVEYKITYELDGGTNSESNPSKYTIEDEIVFASAAKEGYELVGWYSDAKYQNKVEKIEKGTTGNLTLYALYDVAKFSITFYGNGGLLASNSENIVIEDVIYNTQFIELNTLLNSYGFAPAKEGYRLAAFAYSATGDPIPMNELNQIVIKADLELYAYWAKQCKVRLNYLNDYKETIYDSFNKKTFPASILEDVKLDGYNIIGWLDEDGKDFDLNTPFDRDFVLTAKVTPIEYTITYNLDGGTNNANNPSTYTIEDEVTFADASKEGYDFAGWNDADGASITKIEKGTIGNKTLTATYNIKKFDVVFYVDGGKYHTIKNVEYNNPTNELPDDPEKSGYNFDGWYLDENHTKVFNPKTTLITENTNVYAKFVDPNASVLNVIECVGANEAVYVKISVADGYEVNDYKVYYLLNNEYVKVDSQLVRKISGDSEYIRADIVGLAAGKYTIKVELGDATTTRNVMVSAQDRSGYAHFNYEEGVGAYNNDGTLKANAVVVYVNESNKNTVTTKIGSSTKTGLANILKAATNASIPVDVRILGTIGAATWKPLTVASYSAATTSTVKGANGQYLALQSYDESDLIRGGFNELNTTNYSKLEGLSNKIKYDSSKKEFDSYYNMLDISNAKNVTVEGIGDDARIFQWGFTWKSCTSIEVKNLTFDDYTEDACSFEGGDDSTTLAGFKTGHLWIHHNTFERGVNYWDVCSEQDKHDGDGTTDFKKLAYVTLSYNHYIGNHKTGLVGGSDTQHTACVTFHHNFYDQCQSRLPFARQANMHMYNNYYYKSSGNNMQIYAGAFAFIENCYFKNTNNTFTLKTSDGKVAAVKSYNNTFDSCSSSGATIVTSRTETVSNGNLYGQAFDTDSTIFYYDSTNQKSNVSIMNETEDVPEYVALHAGAGSGYYSSLGLYSEAVVKHTVTFKYTIDNTLTTAQTIEVIDGGTVSMPTLDLEGYEVLGWYKNEALTESFDNSNEITEDIIVYAKLKKLASYTVEFVYNLGQDDIGISNTTVYEGNKVSKPSNPTLIGYKFIDWYTDTDYETVFNFNNVISKNTVVYAKFEEVTVSITHLKFDEVNDATYTENVELTNGLIIYATSSKNVVVYSDNVTCGEETVTKNLYLPGGGSTSYRNIKFSMPSTGSVIVYYKASANRHLVLDNGATKVSSDDTTGNLQSYTFADVSAGDYYLYSASSGIYVYMITIVVDKTNQNPEPENYEKLELGYYYTARNTLKNTSYNNGQYPAMHVKTIYKVGEQFDSTYLSAIIDNQYITTGFTFSGFDSSTTGKKTITVTYGNYQGTFDVYVLAADFEVASNDKGYYAIVSSNYVVGETFESGNTIFTKFKTINQALEALEMVTPTATKRAYLQIAAGYYNEKVVINVPYLTITGSGVAKATYEQDESYDAVDLARATVIEWDSLYGTTTEGNGSTGSNSLHVTDSTQTVYITEKAINCEIESLTISNANNCYSYFTNVVKSHAEHRALALLVQADMVRLTNVALLGYQDTVEFFTGRHLLDGCYISGATDYIFGTNGTTFIQNSIIHTVYNGSNTQGGYVNAFKGQNTDSSDAVKYGCIYDGCTFEADSAVANGIIALGRPWTASSSVMIMNSTISAKYSTTPTASSSVGRYCDWNSSILASNAKFYEYNNNGDGAINASITGCTVLTDATEAAKYNNLDIIFGKTNGKVKYDNVWDGTTKPIVNTNVYYYFDGTATTSGYTFTTNDNVNGTTGTFGNMTIDATNGKLEARSNDTQMNAGTIITFTVTKASTVTITFNHYQEAYTVNGVASTDGVYSIDVEANTTITFVATATSYLKSIIIS